MRNPILFQIELNPEQTPLGSSCCGRLSPSHTRSATLVNAYLSVRRAGVGIRDAHTRGQPESRSRGTHGESDVSILYLRHGHCWPRNGYLCPAVDCRHYVTQAEQPNRTIRTRPNRIRGTRVRKPYFTWIPKCTLEKWVVFDLNWRPNRGIVGLWSALWSEKICRVQ